MTVQLTTSSCEFESLHNLSVRLKYNFGYTKSINVMETLQNCLKNKSKVPKTIKTFMTSHLSSLLI